MEYFTGSKAREPNQRSSVINVVCLSKEQALCFFFERGSRKRFVCFQLLNGSSISRNEGRAKHLTDRIAFTSPGKRMQEKKKSRDGSLNIM